MILVWKNILFYKCGCIADHNYGMQMNVDNMNTCVWMNYRPMKMVWLNQTMILVMNHSNKTV